MSYKSFDQICQRQKQRRIDSALELINNDDNVIANQPNIM